MEWVRRVDGEAEGPRHSGLFMACVYLFVTAGADRQAGAPHCNPFVPTSLLLCQTAALLRSLPLSLYLLLQNLGPGGVPAGKLRREASI